MLPIAQGRATPAFGSGQRAGTEVSLRDELSALIFAPFALNGFWVKQKSQSHGEITELFP